MGQTTYKTLTIRLPTRAKALNFALIDKIANQRGMTRSQWVRMLIVQELERIGHILEKDKSEELQKYSEEITDEAVYRRYCDFAKMHNTEAESSLRPTAPKRSESIRYRLTLKPNEWAFIEDFGHKILMTPTEIASVIVRQWVGLNKKPPEQLFNDIYHVRADIRRIAVNINQLALSANKFAKIPSLLNHDNLETKLKDLPDYIANINNLVDKVAELLAVNHAVWNIKKENVINSEVEAHPVIQPDYIYKDLL